MVRGNPPTLKHTETSKRGKNKSNWHSMNPLEDSVQFLVKRGKKWAGGLSLHSHPWGPHPCQEGDKRLQGSTFLFMTCQLVAKIPTSHIILITSELKADEATCLSESAGPGAALLMEVKAIALSHIHAWAGPRAQSWSAHRMQLSMGHTHRRGSLGYSMWTDHCSCFTDRGISRHKTTGKWQYFNGLQQRKKPLCLPGHPDDIPFSGYRTLRVPVRGLAVWPLDKSLSL